MTADHTPSPVFELAERFWEGLLERQPYVATSVGDDRYDDRLDDPGPDGRAREVAALQEVLDGAAAIDRARLTVEDEITLDMLQVVAHLNLRAHDQALWQLGSVDQFGGPQNLPGELARIQRVDGPERVERLLARLAAYPAYVEAHIGVLRDGAAAGRTAARPVVQRVEDQLERALAEPTERAPLLVAHPELAESDRERIGRALDGAVRPALLRFREALGEYASAARAADGLWSIPEGDAAYGTYIEASTTLPLTPRELHDHGLARIEALDAERATIARAAGHATLASYRAEVAADPANRTADGDRIVALCEAQIERALAAAPRVFRRLPRASCVVRRIETFMAAEAPPAFYVPPTPDGARPGTYYVNTHEPAGRPLHRIAATTFHEAVPGHHFQLAREMELEGLPRFRTLGSRLAGIAYTEGWGLYSERLADELGLYLDERERFAMLDAQAWRAARLVVDTGIHAFQWDRARSVAYLEAAAGLPSVEAQTEADRYIGWPGQALAYMTGQRELEALRHELEARDGSRFDPPGFHDALLDHGALPLVTLRRHLPAWVRPATDSPAR